MHRKIARYSQLGWSALCAARYANRRNLIGRSFGTYGRRMGFRAIARGYRTGIQYVLSPVSAVRYFEFDYVWSMLPQDAIDLADMASPRLFAIRVAEERPQSRVWMINPDLSDVLATRGYVGALGLKNFTCTHTDARMLTEREGAFDCIWSISVIEHIAGLYDDTSAIQWLYRALKPGGRLILTIPVDHTNRDEYRFNDPYGTQRDQQTDAGKYFFCRWYDAATIQSRLLNPIGRPAIGVRWFG